jgi:hypothetical protein
MSISHWVAHLTLSICLVFACIGWYQSSHKAADQVAVIQTLLRAKEADSTSLATREVAQKVQVAKRVAVAASANAALAIETPWATTPIPESVQNALAQ